MEEQGEQLTGVVPRGKRFLKEIWEIVRVLLVSAAVVLPIRYFIAQPFIVRGASMEPNFEDREYLIIDELSYYLRAPERGEVIVFRYPKDPSEFFIKRIIGLPGERVGVERGKITISNAAHPQGIMVQEPYLSPPGHLTHPDMNVVLGPKEYFVLGDNRDFSSDSRIWGTLNRSLMVGRVIFRAWPADRFGSPPAAAFNF